MLGSHPIKNESLTISTLTDLDKRNINTTYDYDRLSATRINEISTQHMTMTVYWRLE